MRRALSRGMDSKSDNSTASNSGNDSMPEPRDCDEISQSPVSQADSLVDRAANSGSDGAGNAVGFPDIQSGRYQFLETLGAGRKGIVYKALDLSLGKTVAIKKLHALTEPRQAVKFQREAKVVGTLNHPNVMTALDFGLTSKNEPYLVLDYFEGESLQEWLTRNGPPSVEDALPIFLQIVDGLAHAHNRNVIHRDIKPSNIMFATINGGEPKVQIVDFGLAKQQKSDQGVTTSSGPGVGTPTYMSPEQVCGSKIDSRTDIYSLGCLMFETLIGRPPFEGDTPMETMQMHLYAKPPSLRSVWRERSSYGDSGRRRTTAVSDTIPSAALERIIARCLSKSPDERYSSMGDLRADLHSELETILTAEDCSPVQAFEQPQVSSLTRLISRKGSGKASRKNLLLLSGASLGALALLGVIGFICGKSEPSPHQEKLPAPHEPASESLPMPGMPGVVGYTPKNKRYWFTGNDRELEQIARGNASAAQTMDLENSQVTAAGLLTLKKNSVEHINWRSHPLTKECLKSFCQIKSLNYLEVGETKDVDYESLEMLSTLPDFRELTFHNIEMNAPIIKKIAAIHKLQILCFDNCPGLTAESLSLLRPLPKLSKLKTFGLRVSDDVVKGVANLDIVSMEIKNSSITDESLRIFSSLKHLKLLQLSNCKSVSTKAIHKLEKERKDLQISVKNDEMPGI